MNTLKTFWNKSANKWLCYVLLSIIPFFYLLEKIVCSVYDSDMYFLIATGREILQHGIPHTNVWTIDSESGIIVQQWLYDVILAFVDQFGYIGFSVFVFLEIILFAFIWVRFFALKHISPIISLPILIMVSMPTQYYLFSVRPQVITMILLLSSCIALEKFAATGEKRHLVLLVLYAFLEMQVHASMWFLHFAIILAYMVPAFYFKPLFKDFADNAMYRQWQSLLVTIICMFGVLFINPYGVDGVFYIIKTFKAHTFAYVNVVEVSMTEFLSQQGAVVILCLVLFLIAMKLKHLTSVDVNITAGFCLMMMLAIRNNTCSIFVFAFLMRSVALSIEEHKNKFDLSKDFKYYLVPILLFADLIFVTNFLSSAVSVFTDESGMESSLPKIAEEIDSDYSEDMHIFTGFNCGAYFEYEGFKNLYIDARPEIYTKEFTGNKNILEDYSRFCCYGYDPSKTSLSSISASSAVTKDEMDDWFYSYDFDYVIVSTLSEPYLAAYMLDNTDYQIIEDASDSYYILYRKVE